MKTLASVLMALLLVALVGVAGAYDNCPSMNQYLVDLPEQPVSAQEAATLGYMRQEEKLARDVYQYLSGLWGQRVFSNIAAAEQQHMDAVKVLLDKYGLDDPVAGVPAGVFPDSSLQALYDQLAQKGASSLALALEVGATIEDVDIYDLLAGIGQTDNQDIKTLYQNLMKGSRNHLRAFARNLEANGVSYEAQFLSQAEVDAILASGNERGLFDSDGNLLCFSGGQGAGGRGNGNQYGRN